MKQLIFTALFLASFASVSAQTPDNLDAPLWMVASGEPITVYAEKAYVRSIPSVQGTIIDSLSAGMQVLADSLLTTSAKPVSMKGMVAPWLQVQYKNVKGYVWVGLMSLGSYTKGDTTFLYGIEKRMVATDSETLVIRIKAVDAAHHIIASQDWMVSGGENARSTEGKLLGDMGLEGVQDIVRIYFSGDACALPTNYYYFGWNGQSFLPLPEKMAVSDAGAYNYYETMIFPKEVGGQPGKILKLKVSEEMAEDGMKIEKKTVEREVYTWDGKKATKI